MGHGGDRLADVVEDDHAVIEGEAEVGQAAVVGRRVRQPLDVAHGVVGGVTDGAAAEARQAGDVRRLVGGHLLFQQRKRIGMLHLDGRPARGLKDDAGAERLEAQEGAGADEAVTAEPLAADDALEQKRPFALLNLTEGADGRERVADELAVDRHQAGLAGQLDEFLEGRMVAHGSVQFSVFSVQGPKALRVATTILTDRWAAEH